MGNNNLGAVRFSQSENDFPLLVTLGDKTPSWGLSRWKEENSLSFIPLDDEGFSLRGDKRQLLYKGRRRSHRFTILGDGAFEYDCILEKEPESNVVTLLMNGSEQYDFFRQPDYVPDDFLKGSYAVYKKETLIGQGTGKLCHIHRPLIIDARGRKVWGDLSVFGNELRITIPECWLSGAKYPVIVDPIVGTNTIGSQTTAAFKYQSGYTENGLMSAIVVNQYSMPEAYNGTMNAFVYAFNRGSYGQCRPVLYADFGGMQPMAKRSAEEGLLDIVVNLTDKPLGWRSTTFNTNTNIQPGYIWYGISAVSFFFAFDFANKAFWYPYSNNQVNIPSSYPLFPDQRNYNYRISMYFSFTNPQNFIRTLTQGVDLYDTQKKEIEYKKNITHSVTGLDFLNSSFLHLRHCFSNVISNMALTNKITFIRLVNEQIRMFLNFSKKREMMRKCEDVGNAFDEINSGKRFFSWIIDNLKSEDNLTFPVFFIRSVSETQRITDTLMKIEKYFRGLYEEAGIIVQMERKAGFNRITRDTIKAEGSLFRHLFIFIKLACGSVIRDFILRRFLISQEKIYLKSKITINISLESKII